MIAEIITIGDEILIGQIVDSNSAYISASLNKIGVSVERIISIQDKKQSITKALNESIQNAADIIIITGGLGPTKDDVTKHALCEYFEDKLVLQKNIQEHIKHLFAKIKYQYTDLDLQQAMLPSKAVILKNHYGTASGMWFRKGNTVIISLPGVPAEMKGLIDTGVLPKIQETFKLPFLIHKTIITYGMGESKIAKRLEKWEEILPESMQLAYLPSYGKTRLRLSAKGNVKEEVQVNFNKFYKELRDFVSDLILEEDDELIEVNIGKILTRKNKTLATAESCTGGNIARMITSVPGSSRYFIGAIVSYNRSVKEEVLHVAKTTIEKYSIVSAEVAKEMAIGIQKLYKVDYAIAVTGNAGPTTDKTDTSVGDVFIAIITPQEVFVEKFNFGQPREKVIQRASVKGLELLKKYI